MLFRKDNVVESFLFPGRPVAARIGQVVLSQIGRAADVLVIGRGSAWVHLLHDLPDETKSKLRVVDQGSDFSSTVIGLAAAGSRVTGFSTSSDAGRFMQMVARRPFPIAAVVHSLGGESARLDEYGFMLSATTPQESADFALIAQCVSEAALVPGICLHHAIRDPFEVGTLLEPESELVSILLPNPADTIETFSPAQEMLFGLKRRRVPAILDVDRAVGIGLDMADSTERISQAGIGPFYSDGLLDQLGRNFDEFGSLTGRFYGPVSVQLNPDAEFAVLTDGPTEALERYGPHAASERKQRLGILKLNVSWPFPGRDVARLLKGCTVVTVLDAPDTGARRLATSVRTALYQALENGQDFADSPTVFEARLNSRSGVSGPEAMAVFKNMLPGARELKDFTLGVEFAPKDARVPSLESLYQQIRRSYPEIDERGLPAAELEFQALGHGKALVIAGTYHTSVSSVSEALAIAGMETLKQPTATSVDRLSASGGGAAHAIVTIGSMTPMMAELDPIRAIVSTGADELTRWITSGRLVENAAVFLPGSRLSLLPPSVLSEIGRRSVQVYAVNTEPDLSESHTLMCLVAAWLKSDLEFAGHYDALLSGFLTVLTEKARWSRKDLETASRLLIASEGVRWSPSLGDLQEHLAEPVAPAEIRQASQRTGDLADASRFWRTVGYSFANDQQHRLSPDPYISSNVVPSRTGSFRSGSPRLDQLPELYPENCTGCNACAAFCPDGAVETVACSIEALVTYAVDRVQRAGHQTVQLERIAKPLSKQAHRVTAKDALRQYTTIAQVLELALEPVLEAMSPASDTKREILEGFASVLDIIGDLPVIRTESFFNRPEAQTRGSGELFLLAVNPDACTSCGLCASVCPDDAMGMQQVSSDLVSRSRFRSNVVVDNQSDAAAARHSGAMDLMMGRKSAAAVLGSDKAYPGSGVKLTIRLVCAVIEAEMAPRFKALTNEAAELADSLRKEINDVLRKTIDVNDFEDFGKKLDAFRKDTISATELTDVVHGLSDQSVDARRLAQLADTIKELESIRSTLDLGPSGDGRARMAAVFGDGAQLGAHRPFPFNPYSFPWIHLEAGSPVSTAEGLFEGVIKTMGTMFATFRSARRLAKGLNVDDSDAKLSLDDLTEEEWNACPPICVFSDDEADIPRDWLRRRTPINLFILDGNGAPDDEGWDARLWPLAQPELFVLHSTTASFDHFSLGIRDGVAHRGPSVFRLFAPEPGQHGFRPDQTVSRMLSAVRSRAFPLIRYTPDPDLEWTDRWSLSGNENLEDDWASPDEAPAEEAVRRHASAFWRLLQELSGIRTTALAKARQEAEEEIERRVAIAHAASEAGARSEIDRIMREHAAIYHQKLKEKLLLLSRFSPGTEAYEKKLGEYVESE